MPGWNRSIESSDGTINLFTFSVVRLTEKKYAREAHLLIAAVCIERDS